MWTLLKFTAAVACLLPGTNGLDKNLRIGSGGRTLHDFRKDAAARSTSVSKRDIDPSDLYPEHTFAIPVDHFHNETQYEPHSSATFKNRYWFDASHYKKGGPVIILQSGETDATGRLAYLQNGILAQLSEATNGIGVVFEHRYYGNSFPTKDLSIENLRFLTTQQALADEAYFAQNIKFPGLEKYGDLTSKTTAYLSYGGSYSGAFSAFLRVQYPEIFYGSISSSGVTKAIYDYWQYYEPAAQYGPPLAMATQKLFTHVVDNILIGKKDDAALTKQLKAAFGLSGITHTSDFANQLAAGVGWWQSLNWDPNVSDPEFYNFANNLTATDCLYPATESKRSTAEYLIQQGGYTPNTTLVTQMLNYIGYINLTAVAPCAAEGATQDECFGNYNKTFYEQDSLEQYDWRSWAYQYCSEWGYLQTGSGVPANQLPLISRTIDLPYTSTVCRDAFNITKPANVELANKYGGYNIKYPRLAIIDGQWDPWRPATPHAFQYGAKHRTSTVSEPFILISKALHHYDENGRFPNETTPTLPPAPVANTQKAEQKFAQEWMAQFHKK